MFTTQKNAVHQPALSRSATAAQPFFQAKLTVNTPGDAYEQEADRVADQVMRMPEGQSLNGGFFKATPLNGVQRKCAECEKEERAQRKETGGGDASGKAAPQAVSDVLSSGSGQPMDAGTRQWAESRFGQDFGQVRIHTDSRAAESASAIQARAYTSGTNVVFGAGEYQPQSEGGKRLLAHELVHVGQQGGGIGKVARQTTGTLPVERYSPCTGLFIERRERQVTVSGRLTLQGAESSPAIASALQSTINNIWTATFPTGESIRTTITVAIHGSNAPVIEVVRIGTRPSYVRGCSMTLNLDDSTAQTWTVAHEFGHILQLRDRYHEGLVSRIMGMLFGDTHRSTSVESGYQGNIMGQDQGNLTGQNVQDLTLENAPSSYESDDRVRDWVSSNSATAIRALSTTAKRQMIATLLSIDRWGWVSAEDINAVRTICRNVIDSAEANSIRSRFESALTQLTDIGQRTQVRVIFSQMPR